MQQSSTAGDIESTLRAFWGMLTNDVLKLSKDNNYEAGYEESLVVLATLNDVEKM